MMQHERMVILSPKKDQEIIRYLGLSLEMNEESEIYMKAVLYGPEVEKMWPFRYCWVIA